MPKIPLAVKILTSIFFPPIIPLWIILWIGKKIIKPLNDFALKEREAFSTLVNNPNEVNARAYIDLMHNKPSTTLSPENNPNAWAVMREKWQIINHSDQIPTNMKKEIFDILTARGLYVNNSKIINNFSANGGKQCPDVTADEMQCRQNDLAMEEAQKAVTPFDHGGYMQGDGFNPSDTMAAEAQRQLDQMNDMNHMH